MNRTFLNELHLFSEIHNQIAYSVNIYQVSPKATISFDHIVNLFHPSTVDECFLHDGSGTVPGIRDNDGNWNTRGHKNRRISITTEHLQLFAKLFDTQDTLLLQARLPAVHSQEIVNVLKKFEQQKIRLNDLQDKIFSTVMWNETIAQKDGIIRREIRFPSNPLEWILSGPHFYQATPLNKMPNENCRSNKDYSDIDLTLIDDDFLPRTNYVPAIARDKYLALMPKFKGHPIIHYYRHINREMVGPNNERTLISAIIPPEAGHIYTAFSIVFEDYTTLVDFEVLASSICADFFIKTTGVGHANLHVMAMMPLPNSQIVRNFGKSRILRLNCLTTHYATLWKELYDPAFNRDGWTKSDPRLKPWHDLTPHWQRHIALRTPFERRQALVEIDVLAALALNLTLDELLTIYRVQFPVLQKNERRLLFDQRGMEVPVKSAGGELVPNEDDPRFAEMVPPFTPVDREADYRQAWGYFEGKVKEG